MSTQRKHDVRSSSHSGIWTLSIVHGGVFLAGVVAGASLLMRSMRLQSELQADALSVVREQQTRLGEQVEALEQRIEHVSDAVRSLLSPREPLEAHDNSAKHEPEHVVARRTRRLRSLTSDVSESQEASTEMKPSRSKRQAAPKVVKNPNAEKAQPKRARSSSDAAQQISDPPAEDTP